MLSLLLFSASPINALAESNLAFVFPIVSPKLTSKFGTRKHPVYKKIKHHNGLDLAVPANSHVRAVASGKVIFAATHGGYGHLITILHNNGASSMYAHLRKIKVEVGDIVTSGQIIGLVGRTGTATGNHLHFEWREEGKAVDPLKIFPDIAKQAQG